MLSSVWSVFGWCTCLLFKNYKCPLNKPLKLVQSNLYPVTTWSEIVIYISVCSATLHGQLVLYLHDSDMGYSLSVVPGLEAHSSFPLCQRGWCYIGISSSKDGLIQRWNGRNPQGQSLTYILFGLYRIPGVPHYCSVLVDRMVWNHPITLHVVSGLDLPFSYYMKLEIPVKLPSSKLHLLYSNAFYLLRNSSVGHGSHLTRGYCSRITLSSYFFKWIARQIFPSKPELLSRSQYSEGSDFQVHYELELSMCPHKFSQVLHNHLQVLIHLHSIRSEGTWWA